MEAEGPAYSDGSGAKGEGIDTGWTSDFGRESGVEATAIGDGGCEAAGWASTGTARDARDTGSFSSSLRAAIASSSGVGLVGRVSCSAASLARAERFPSTQPKNNAKPTSTTRIAASSMASRTYPVMVYLSPRCTNVTRRFAA